MNTNTMELNMKEMEAVSGGGGSWNMDRAVMYGTTGLVGGAVVGAVGSWPGMIIVGVGAGLGGFFAGGLSEITPD